jgi:hypothetical protein
MFANFALPDLARVSRRTVLGGLVFGVIGLIACLALGAPLTGLGLCVGLGLGLFNFRLIQRSVIKVGAREDENHKRPLAANTVAGWRSSRRWPSGSCSSPSTWVWV